MTLGRGTGARHHTAVLDLPRPAPAPIRTLGEIAYGAYRMALAARGQPAPEWAALDSHHRAALEAAGSAVQHSLARVITYLPPSLEARRARP